jgi:hypothetical protein
MTTFKELLRISSLCCRHHGYQVSTLQLNVMQRDPSWLMREITIPYLGEYKSVNSKASVILKSPPILSLQEKRLWHILDFSLGLFITVVFVGQLTFTGNYNTIDF